MHLSFPCAATIFVFLALPIRAETVAEAARALEADLGGRIGIVLREPGGEPLAGWRTDERFPMASTFKAPLCGAILAKVDAGEADLTEVVSYGAGDLVEWSPVTEKHVDAGMRLADLCHATITMSDNTAANLLLDTIDGPAGLTDFLRGIGDVTTRLDRREPALNEGAPGDLRDTTTPAAMADTLEALLFSSALSPEARAQLESWMEQDQVADALLRASLPEGWTIGDKTGAGGHGSRSIIAVLRSPAGKPWLATVYMTQTKADADGRNAAIARIGAAMFADIAAQE